MKLLLFGSSGMLGHDLVASAPSSIDIVPLDHDACDVTDKVAVKKVIATVQPEVVINAAAYTAVDRAETERAAADAVNGLAVGEMGHLCRSRGIPLVHFSTDYVFPGNATIRYRENDPVAPINAYGASKLLGETLLRDSGAQALVIRTQWLFGNNGRSFPRTMWERATTGQRTRVVDDQVGRPTWTVDLARATWLLVEREVTGTVHVANGGETTWYHLANAVFDMAGTTDLLSACSTSEYPTPARRPTYSALDTNRYEQLAGGPLRPWTKAVSQFVRELRDT